MMPWNRKEVWMGANAQKFSEIKNALAHSQIEYAYDINLMIKYIIARKQVFSRARGKAWRAPGNRVCCRERHAGESGTGSAILCLCA